MLEAASGPVGEMWESFRGRLKNGSEVTLHIGSLLLVADHSVAEVPYFEWPCHWWVEVGLGALVKSIGTHGDEIHSRQDEMPRFCRQIDSSNQRNPG